MKSKFNIIGTKSRLVGRLTLPSNRDLVSPISHEASVRIVSALNNKKYTVRTISGIVHETGLSRAVVLEAIRKNKELAKAVKISPFRSSNGSVLITTKERFNNEASLKEKFIDFFSSRRVGVVDAE